MNMVKVSEYYMQTLKPRHFKLGFWNDYFFSRLYKVMTTKQGRYRSLALTFVTGKC